MSTLSNRLDRALPALSGKERAILILRAAKEKRPSDPAWRRDMPNDQVAAFNRLIDLMNACNNELSHTISFIEQNVAKLDLRLAWLVSLHLWSEQLDKLSFGIWKHVNEPVTVSQHATFLAECAAEMLSPEEAAEAAADAFTGWTERDFVKDDDWPEPLVSDAARNRLVRQRKKELPRLVAGGVLDGRGKGRRLKVRRGSLQEWLGEPLAITPEHCQAFDIHPDEEAEEVEKLRASYADLLETLERSFLSDNENKRLPERLAEPLEAMLLEGMRLRWRELLAVEEVVAWAAGEFDGEDPLRPGTREGLDWTRAKLLELKRHLETLTAGEVDLGEADEELKEAMTAILDKAAK